MPFHRLTSHFFPVYLLLPLALGASACSRMESLFMSNDNAPVISVHEQPHPRQAYRIVMTIENAPGPFAQVEGSARYDVVNYQACGELSRIPGAEGVASRIDHQPEVRMERLSDNTYAATVYADLMVDEDYYGRGTCHWEFKYFSALLRATGDTRETRFLPSIDAGEIMTGKAATWYFPNVRYPVSGLPDFAEFGDQDPSKFKPEIQNQLFRIVLTAQEVQP